MGRDAGWVALAASDAARHVNICLIPEFEVKKIKIINLQFFFFDLKKYFFFLFVFNLKNKVRIIWRRRSL
jgi:hypothetical protein